MCIRDRPVTINKDNNKINSYRMMKLFRSKKHLVETITCNKLALSNLDNKRILCDNKIDTLPYGHYSLVNDGTSF